MALVAGFGALTALSPGKRTIAVSDFAPITLVGILPHVLGVHRGFPAASVKELVALARKSPKKYTYASAGIGTPVRARNASIKPA